jgi:hypothetical protein
MAGGRRFKRIVFKPVYLPFFFSLLLDTTMKTQAAAKKSASKAASTRVSKRVSKKAEEKQQDVAAPSVVGVSHEEMARELHQMREEIRKTTEMRKEMEMQKKQMEIEKKNLHEHMRQEFEMEKKKLNEQRMRQQIEETLKKSSRKRKARDAAEEEEEEEQELPYPPDHPEWKPLTQNVALDDVAHLLDVISETMGKHLQIRNPDFKGHIGMTAETKRNNKDNGSHQPFKSPIVLEKDAEAEKRAKKIHGVVPIENLDFTFGTSKLKDSTTIASKHYITGYQNSKALITQFMNKIEPCYVKFCK